jgi:toxin YoeB
VRVHFTEDGWSDFLSWMSDGDIFEKITQIIEEIRRTPFKGTGKPEPLKRPLQGLWSRRINKEHRIIYRVEGKDDEQRLVITACRYHY